MLGRIAGQELGGGNCLGREAENPCQYVGGSGRDDPEGGV
jgi:hypothetical protein